MADINLEFVAAIPYYGIMSFTIDNNGKMWVTCYEPDSSFYHVYTSLPPYDYFTAFTSIAAANPSLADITTLPNNDKWIVPWTAAPIIINGTTEAVTTYAGDAHFNRHGILNDGTNLYIICLSEGVWKKAPPLTTGNFSQILTHPAGHANPPYGLTGAQLNSVDGLVYVSLYSSPSSNGGAVYTFNPSSPSWVNTGAPNTSYHDPFCAHNGDVYVGSPDLSGSLRKKIYGGGWSTVTTNINRTFNYGWFTSDDSTLYLASASHLYKTATTTVPPPPVALSAVPHVEEIEVTWTWSL